MHTCVLSIAGSDSGAGAGIQADLKTMAAQGVYGLTVVTAVTAQNTTGVAGVQLMPVEMVQAQIDAVAQDFEIAAVKTGMLGNAAIIETVAEKIKEYNLKKTVVDPVMVAKSGDPLLEENAQAAFKEKLFPCSLMITPNVPEAELLTGVTIKSLEDMKESAQILKGMGSLYVLLKGGHMERKGEVTDLLFDGEQYYLYTAQRVESENNHGTGCTFASAIASYLALGFPPPVAVYKARSYLQHIMYCGLNLGRGRGPLNHLAWQEV